jgi:peptide-methionine (S)-S-oxide reductase
MFSVASAKALRFILVLGLTLGFITIWPGLPALAESQTVTLAGGCFWCVEADFDKLPGVLETLSGYTGGTVKNPTYRQVSAGSTGHYEAVQIRYDPEKLSYSQLLNYFWRHIDPLDAEGQFCDRGDQYRSAIFVKTAEQKKLTEMSRQQVQKQLGKPVKTLILPESPFYKAEEYHQDYYRKESLKYNFYRFSCGRDRRVAEVWKK